MAILKLRAAVPGALLALLAACGGGGGSEPANKAPVANAGPAQLVPGGTAVTLTAAASSDADGSITGYAWSQTAGPAVTLSNAASAQPTFTAPSITAATTLAFSLVVTDNDGASSAASTVTVTVTPPVPMATLSGTVRFERVPFLTVAPFGLNYAAPVLQPARGVQVRVLDAVSLVALASTSTDAQGAYSASVPASRPVTVQVVARMQRDATQPLPRWDIRVQDGDGAGVMPYSHTGAVIDSSAGTHDVDIPTGVAANGTATGARASGPFAILDTFYTTMQVVLAAEPNADFPALYVNWGAQAAGTHFDGVAPQHISLRADLTEDTEEFDQHVVAHEFAHYLEQNFSRSDNIGGPHGFGDRLDMRVAFGEGFAYAFAGLVLGDPVVRDSFVDAGVQRSGRIDMEAGLTGLPAGPGCWCNEVSMWAIVWDLHDAVDDAGDTVSLDFTRLWQVLRGPQRTANGLVSIFTYATALKAANPAQVPGIDTLLAAHNINGAGINEFATAETNVPFSSAMLPLYRDITNGTPVVVRTIDDGGLYNKVGSRRLLRYVAPATGTVNITVRSSSTHLSADPDFVVHRVGAPIVIAQAASPQPEIKALNTVAGQTYVIEVYECANGCFESDGLRGDYDLTVTIN